MRIHIGKIPASHESPPEDGWTSIKGPSSIWRWQLSVFPIALANTASMVALWLLLTPARNNLDNMPFPLPVLKFVICLVAVLLVHEMIHLAIHPKMGRLNQSILGFWPSKMLLYAAYNGKLSRYRWIVILLMPFIAISILPVLIAIMFQQYSFWVAYITILNAFVSAGDISLVRMSLKQVPAGATVYNSYWKQETTNVEQRAAIDAAARRE